MTAKKLTVALAGNPNSGKTTIFNALTKQRQHVGNYPGVTVEKKEGFATFGDTELEIVDLPGTYSLTAYSIEEIVARNFLLEDQPDVVIDIIDAANLERNLYLATQLVECGVPLVLAFNMSDIAEARGYRIDTKMLSRLLGVPIVHTVGHKQRGLDDLLRKAVDVAQNPQQHIAAQRIPAYGHEVEHHVADYAEFVGENCKTRRHRRWFAVKLLEGDEETIRRMQRVCPDHADELLRRGEKLRKHIESVCGDSAEIIFADRRYGFISGACTEAVKQTVEARHARSDRIDTVLTNRFIGLPLFALMMFLVFQLTFALGNPLVELLDVGKEHLADLVRSLGPENSPIISLLADGIIEGVGSVVSFVPLIALLYLAIAILEDSGYMARAAFVLDKLMHHIGLHGKSFIPMVIGFGCTVPGIMATRILENRRDRLTTTMVLPLMGCGARVPVYVLILGAFFPPRTLFGLFHTGINAAGESTYLISITNQALILFGIYVLGIVLAIVGIKLLRSTLFRGEVTPFVMELPPYRMPAIKGLIVHMWERSWMFVRKAGTVILAIVMVLWALQAWPGLSQEQKSGFEEQREQIRADYENSDKLHAALAKSTREQERAALENSAIGRIGKTIAPVLKPCGFDWKISTALLGAAAAKEVFIGQMGLIYAVSTNPEGESATEGLRSTLQQQYSPLQGICIMLFTLIGTPCIATIAVTYRETKSWRWTLLQWGGLTLMAWIVTTAAYQVGMLLGF